MVGTGESTVAHLATERLHSCVLTVVAGELVRTGKSPLATFPVTDVWFLSGVRTEVRLEVGALTVELVASLVWALVHLLAFSWSSFSRLAATGRNNVGHITRKLLGRCRWTDLLNS